MGRIPIPTTKSCRRDTVLAMGGENGSIVQGYVGAGTNGGEGGDRNHKVNENLNGRTWKGIIPLEWDI